MTRPIRIAAALAMTVAAGAATAQTAETTSEEALPPTAALLRQACLASAENRFGASDATIIDETPIEGGMEMTVSIPGRDDPWTCNVVVGGAYDGDMDATDSMSGDDGMATGNMEAMDGDNDGIESEEGEM